MLITRHGATCGRDVLELCKLVNAVHTVVYEDPPSEEFDTVLSGSLLLFRLRG